MSHTLPLPAFLLLFRLFGFFARWTYNRPVTASPAGVSEAIMARSSCTRDVAVRDQVAWGSRRPRPRPPTPPPPQFSPYTPGRPNERPPRPKGEGDAKTCRLR